MRIAILCHWHTGSTLLAKTLKLCGMEVGNANTDWHSDCEAQCEHGRLNGLGDAFLLGRISESELRDGITQILISYVEEASLKGWEHYGVKITHAVQKEIWPIFKELFDYLWDPVYMTMFRHTLGVIKSTSGDDKWSSKRIINSYREAGPAIKEIVNNGVVFHYPNDWFDNKIQEKVEKIGLIWNKEAESLFDPMRQRTFTEYELMEYAREGI